MAKQQSYIDLLKESIMEYDASVMNYKGPLLDPIITFDGDEDKELKTNKEYKDAGDLLERLYAKEVAAPRARNLIEDAQEEDPEQNEVETGETPDSIPETLDDLRDDIDEDDGGTLSVDDSSYITNESTIDDEVLAQLIAEMEDISDIPEDEEGMQAGTDVISPDEAEDLLDEFLMLEDDAKEDDAEEDEPLDVDKETDTEDDNGGKDEVSESILGGIRRSSHRIREEELEQLTEDFIAQLEGDLLTEADLDDLILEAEDDQEEGSDEDSDEDKEDKDEKDNDEKDNKEDIEKMIESLLLDEGYLEEDDDRTDFDDPEDNEIETGGDPDKVDATMDDFEEEITDGEDGFLDLDESIMMEGEDSDEENSEDEDSDEENSEDEDSDEKNIKESIDVLSDEEIEFLLEDENEDLLKEFMELV